jgi:Arc/MetJ-type ribon-helix-helix transcriptional regulator
MKEKAGALMCYLTPEQKQKVRDLTKNSDAYKSISTIVRIALDDFLKKVRQNA